MGRLSRRTRLPYLGVGRSKLVRLGYVQHTNINPGAGGIGSHSFRCNGIFDPDAVLGGHKARGMDEWMVFFRTYTVLGAQIKLRQVPNITGSGDPCLWGCAIRLEAGLGGVSNAFDWLESKENQGPIRLGNTVNSFAPTLKPYVRNWSAKKAFGHKNLIGLPEYSGDITSVPSIQNFFVPWCSSTDGTNDPPITNFIVTLSYVVLFTDPIPIPAS